MLLWLLILLTRLLQRFGPWTLPGASKLRGVLAWSMGRRVLLTWLSL